MILHQIIVRWHLGNIKVLCRAADPCITAYADNSEKCRLHMKCYKPTESKHLPEAG